MLTIHGFIMNTMFDSSATHSFISYDCVKCLGLKVDILPYDLSISTPTGNHVLTFKAYLNCVIQFDNKCSTLDLICLPLHGIDVIIGMD